MQSSARSTLRAVLKLVVLGASLFVLLEISARVYFFGFAGLVPEKINSVHGLPQTEFTQRSTDPELGFELKPNLDGYFKLVPFRTNSRGFRDREYTLSKPKDTFRVAVVGSSFALPAGVEIEQAFHSLLEERFSAEFAPTHYEFINFAVGMYSPKQVLAMLELRALEYHPDLILFTLTEYSMSGLIEDPSSKPSQSARQDVGDEKILPKFQKSYPILQSFFVRLLMERTGHGPKTPQLHVGVIENLFMTWVDRRSVALVTSAKDSPKLRRQQARAPENKFEPVGGSVIERLANVQASTGIPIVLVRLEIDPKERLPIDFEVEEKARTLGLYYVDTRDAFQGTNPRDFWIYELDPHPNRAAHEIFAKVIAKFLRSNDLLGGDGHT